MKFYHVRIILLLILYTCILSFTEKRDATMMEMFNNFFTEDTKVKTFAQKQETKPEQTENTEKKDYRFKEGRGAAARAVPVNGDGSVANTVLPDQATDLFMISSAMFKNKERYPAIRTNDGKDVSIQTDPADFRINNIEQNTSKLFRFRLNPPNIYYALNEHDFNVLGFVNLNNLNKIVDEPATIDNKEAYCFKLYDNVENWKVCNYNKEIVLDWICIMKKYLKQSDSRCNDNVVQTVLPTAPMTTTKVTQPIIVIPLPSRHCNDGWNYKQGGNDWECMCKEGKEQSPIDLPDFINVRPIDSPVRPYFEYGNEINNIPNFSTFDGTIQEGKPLQLHYMDNSIRIIHPNLGKVVTLDGAFYNAQEIVFHTPSEHTIGGKQYDMELQIIHYGQSVGDIAKQVVLCFLFEKVPGVFNKFIDDLEIYDLPNLIKQKRDIEKKLFLPKIFYNTEDTDYPTMKSFSFYTYQGSLTSPPCSEDTIVYVASKPLPVGNITIELFKEAIKISDAAKGQQQNSENSRKTQPLNGRPVYHYDHVK
jgi:carbonic anhydrase